MPPDSLPEDLSLQKFGVGQPVPRMQDPRLLRGEGHYSDDLNLPKQAHAVMIRSRYAHGIIRKIDTEAARAMPGVLGIWTGADLADYGPLKCVSPFLNKDGSPMFKPVHRVLTTDKVRYVGDMIGFIVAETVAQAKDAAEAVELEIESLPAVTDARAAAAPGAPLIHDDVPNNVALDYHYGDAAKVAAAFAQAAHVTRLDILNTRLIVSAMEPRSALASHDEAEGWTLRLGSQGVFGLRAEIAGIVGVKPDRLRVLTEDVGGSFGMKSAAYPEYVCVMHAARALNRPVKWTDERSESFVSDTHGRDSFVTGEIALDKDGHFLAVRFSGYAAAGAYLTIVGPLAQTLNVPKNSMGVYQTPIMEHSLKFVLTNNSPVGPYRGAGRPEGNYFMQRLVDAAAVDMGIDRLEIRRRNQIQPAQIPFKSASEQVYDSGDFPGLFTEALKASDWSGFAQRRAASKAKGKLRGIGMSDFLEVTAGANKEMGGLRFETDGTVTMITGTLDYGQGHATPFAQVVVDRLGIPFERLRLLQGDSRELLAGGGTGGSRSAMNSSAALIQASDEVIANGRKIAAVALEAAVEDIEFGKGRFIITGTDRSVGLMELADQLRAGTLKLPADVPQSLDAKTVYNGAPSAFPNGCHIAEVEIDPETGVVEVVKYTAVNDFGTVINPLLVEGQLHGGVVQGLGQALTEQVAYDESGQLLSGSYMDYGVPRADNAPNFTSFNHPTLAKTNPLGVKGCGEAGCAGSFPSIMNAVVDALGEYGIRHIDMPATPQRVWAAIRDAQHNRA